ncbi:MAG: aspartate ammonia-lyase [Actinobacteria bacterium]|nr:aspartate ammonia-lyase [Actinomycetota bacterium]
MTRVEHDLLGDREVPGEAYYGVQTTRAVENFQITGQRLHPELIKALAIVKKAAAKANMAVGLLPREIGGAIVKAADEVAEGKFSDEFLVDPIQGGAGTSANMNANEVIANRAIEILGGRKGNYQRVSPNTHVNMSQSTNDVFPTAIRIAALYRGRALLEAMDELERALRAKELEFNSVLKMGRTHLQDAVPITLGQEFGAYAEVIGRSAARIRRSLDSLKEVNMGATAVGTGLNADPQYIKAAIENLRAVSGLDLRPVRNLVDGTQNTDALVEASGSLKALATSLSKVANDLRLMASGPRCGLKEINLPERQPGSSIMPGKVNPVIPEVVNQVAFQVIGNDLTITLAVEAGQLELNVMEPVAAFNLLQSFDVLEHAVRALAQYCVSGITANVDRCRTMVENSVGVITAVNPHLGYEKTSAVAREAVLSGRPVREIILEKGYLSPEELDLILSPEQMTRPGIAGAKLLDKPHAGD